MSTPTGVSIAGPDDGQPIPDASTAEILSSTAASLPDDGQSMTSALAAGIGSTSVSSPILANSALPNDEQPIPGGSNSVIRLTAASSPVLATPDDVQLIMGALTILPDPAPILAAQPCGDGQSVMPASNAGISSTALVSGDRYHGEIINPQSVGGTHVHLHNLNASGVGRPQPLGRPQPAHAPAVTPPPPPARVEDPAETYPRILTTKHGYPLWRPDPAETPPEHRRQGINIGDVGKLEPDGKFLFLFNVFLSNDSPANTVRDLNCDSLEHLAQQELDSRAYFPGQVIKSTGITVSQPVGQAHNNSAGNPQPPSFQFFCPLPEGAILVLPNGATRFNLLTRRPMEDYIRKNITNWYGSSSIDEHEDLLIVTGVDKCSSWGTACWSEATGSNEISLSFIPEADDNSPTCRYAWQPQNSVCSRSGRNAEADCNENQCVFIRAYKAKLRRTLLRTQVAISDVVESKANTPIGGANGRPGATLASWVPSFLRSTNVEAPCHDHHYDAASDTIHVDEFPVQNKPFHPLDLINSYLLDTNPEAQIAITHDDIWCSVIREDDNMILGSAKLLERVLEKYSVIQEHECVSLIERPVKESMASTLPEMVHVPILDGKKASAQTFGESGEMEDLEKITYPRQVATSSNRPLALLSLDGGGYRGLALLYQLKHIMQQLPDIDPNAPIYPYKHFDLIGGTSTGGLIAIMLGRLRMSIDEVIEKYQELGNIIFGGNSDKVMQYLRTGAQFDAGPFEDEMKGWKGEESLPDPDIANGCRCFVTTMPAGVIGAEPILLRSYPSPPTALLDVPQGHIWRIWEAARATSAASTYFPPLDLDHGHVFRDAAMYGSNNPVLHVIHEAGMIPEFRNRSIGCLVSLGTGLGMLVSADQPVPVNAPVPASQGDFTWQTIQRLNYWFRVPGEVSDRCRDLCKDLVAVATNAEEKHRGIARNPPQSTNLAVYFRLNPHGGLGNLDLADFTRGAQILGLVNDYLENPDTRSTIRKCVIALSDCQRPGSPDPPSPSFRPIYTTGFEVDPFTISEDEARSIYRDLLPREPLVGYNYTVGNGAFTIKFDGLNKVRWRSFLNAALVGPIRVEAAVDLSQCVGIGVPSGAGILVILPDDEVPGKPCCDYYFIVEPAELHPTLRVLKVPRTISGSIDNWKYLHTEVLSHCQAGQVVHVEITMLERKITVATNQVLSAWTFFTDTSGGPEGYRAIGLCGIGAGQISWRSLVVSIAEDQVIVPRQEPNLSNPPSGPSPNLHSLNPAPTPEVNAIPLKAILFTKIAAPHEAIMTKLLMFIDTLPLTNIKASKALFSDEVLPFLMAQFQTVPNDPMSLHLPVRVPIPPKFLLNWKKATVKLFDLLQPEQLFPLVDLWRIALLDERVAIWCTTKDGADLIPRMLLKVNANKGNTTPPWNLLLTSLRLAANCFSSDMLGRYSSKAGLPRVVRTDILIFALTHDAADKRVRNAGAIAAFNEAVLNQKLIDDGCKDEEWEVRMVGALVEAIRKEKESEDTVYRLTASLALLLRNSPFFEDTLKPLVVTLRAAHHLCQKLLPGECGKTGVVKASVRALIEEVAGKLCTAN